MIVRGVPEGEEEGDGEEDIEDDKDGVTPGNEFNGGNFKDYTLPLHFHNALVFEQDAARFEDSVVMLPLLHFHINNVSKFRKKG